MIGRRERERRRKERDGETEWVVGGQMQLQ